MNITNKEAIADAGATEYFVLPGTPHTCDLYIEDIPEQAKPVHIVPGLSHASLISISVLYDTVFKVHYDENLCSVYYN